jgi:hypothetical protein
VNDEEGVKDIKGAMQDFLDSEGMHEFGGLLKIKESWTEVVGGEVAGLAKPYRLEKGRLYIGVGSHARVQDMLFQAEDIKRRIKEKMGMEIEGVIVRNINIK